MSEKLMGIAARLVFGTTLLTGGVYLAAKNHETPTRVGKLMHENRKFKFSPDLKQFVYIDTLPKDGDGSLEAIMLVNENGEEEPVITSDLNGSFNFKDLNWSPDGKYLSIGFKYQYKEKETYYIY